MEGLRMRCPHCEAESEVIRIGFSGDWVLCQACHRRLKWVDVRRKWLIKEGTIGESESSGGGTG